MAAFHMDRNHSTSTASFSCFASGAGFESWDFPLPEPDGSHMYRYPGSEGFAYEIAEVHRCIALGLIESPSYTHAETLGVSKTLEEVRTDRSLESFQLITSYLCISKIRRQVGVKYSADDVDHNKIGQFKNP
jgi:hypothetical protein